jgi:hypothetical protein
MTGTSYFLEATSLNSRAKRDCGVHGCQHVPSVPSRYVVVLNTSRQVEVEATEAR